MGTIDKIGPYPKGSLWAEPDLDHAIALMKFVVKNYSQACQVAMKASQTIRLSMGPTPIGQRIKDRLSYVFQIQKERAALTFQEAAWKRATLRVFDELKVAEEKLRRVNISSDS